MGHGSLETPIGHLTVIVRSGAVTELNWQSKHPAHPTPDTDKALTQLAAYFAGTIHQFDLALHPSGSRFQNRVRAAMMAIPFGQTRTYGDLAKTLGVSAQAIGVACAGNPIPVIIPCHRVLGANGLGGYSGMGGIETKVWLLRHEGAAGLLI